MLFVLTSKQGFTRTASDVILALVDTESGADMNCIQEVLFWFKPTVVDKPCPKGYSQYPFQSL